MRPRQLIKLLSVALRPDGETTFAELRCPSMTETPAFVTFACGPLRDMIHGSAS